MIAFVLCAQLATASTPVRFELPNGLRVWVQEDHTRPVALVQVTYKVGSLQEGPGITGIAHFVEHMVYRATANVRNEDIYGYIDRIGGRYTGGTWPDFTRYTETVPSWAVEDALRVSAERMSRALFDSLEFERERSNVVTEANGFADTDPVSVFKDAVMSTAFELHPYRYSSNTWARDNLTLTRAEAYDWYKRYYGPNNAVLVVVGDITVDAVRGLVERHFASLPRAPESGEIKVQEPPQVAEKRVLLRYVGDKKRMEIAYRAPAASSRDYPTLLALNRRLAPGLARIAREANSKITSKDSATSYPYVYRVSVTADSGADLDSILEAIDAEIDRLRTGAIGTHVEPATNQVAAARVADTVAQNANFPPRQSSLTRIADQLSARERFGWEVGAATIDSARVAATRVTVAEVQAYADRWLRPSQRTVGFLVPAPARDAFQIARTAVPALTTKPAKRRRPEPVPDRALQPLTAIAIERTRRVLPNGIPVRVGRVATDRASLHVVVDYGPTADTLIRRFSLEKSDSALSAAVAAVRAKYAVRPPPKADTSLSAQARARVLAAITPAISVNTPSATVTVSAVGPRPVAHFVGDVARHFQTLPRNHEPRPVMTPLATPGIRHRIPVAGATQVSIVAGLPGVPRAHPDRRALELLNYIVGVPWYGGRLGWALTKTGLTYSSAATTMFGALTGHILFSTTADSRNAESAIQAITEVVAGVGDRGVEEWELREAQAFTLGRTLLYGAREQSGADAIALALTNSEDAGLDLLDLPALSRAYLSVTLADINRVARTYYRQGQLAVVAMGALPTNPQPRVFPDGTFRALFEP